MTPTKHKSKSELNASDEKLIQIMKILGDKTSYKMFKLIMDKDELCVSDIAKELNVTLSAVSQHFRQFELIGLVQKERMGQKICYMLDDDNMMVDNLKEIIKTNK